MQTKGIVTNEVEHCEEHQQAVQALGLVENADKQVLRFTRDQTNTVHIQVLLYMQESNPLDFIYKSICSKVGRIQWAYRCL